MNTSEKLKFVFINTMFSILKYNRRVKKYKLPQIIKYKNKILRYWVDNKRVID